MLSFYIVWSYLITSQVHKYRICVNDNIDNKSINGYAFVSIKLA
jgi:hypothetical protein